MRIDLNQEAQLLPESGRTSSQGLVNQGSVNQSSANQSSVSASASSATSPAGEDQARLSGVYGQIRVLAAQASQLPEVGGAKVSALRQMVLGNSYQPSSEQVGEALFAHMLVRPAA
jgi:hypothetical protein